MRNIFIIGLTLMVTIVAVGCVDSETKSNDIQWIDLTVPPGQNAPSPKEAGATYFESLDYGDYERKALSVDLATFTTRWNEAAESVFVEGKPAVDPIRYINVRYALNTVYFEHKPHGWDMSGGIHEETGKIEHIGIHAPLRTIEVDSAAMACLIYAANSHISLPTAVSVVDDICQSVVEEPNQTITRIHEGEKLSMSEKIVRVERTTWDLKCEFRYDTSFGTWDFEVEPN